MMTSGYYYIITSLPEVSLSDKEAEFHVLPFRNWIMELLQPHDRDLLKAIFYPADIRNLAALLSGIEKDWDPIGNISREKWEEHLENPSHLPQFFIDFLDDTVKTKWKVEDHKYILNNITKKFITWSHQLDNAFLRKWFRFEHNLKNLLIWLNSNKFNLESKEEILGHYYEAQYLRNTEQSDINLKAWDYSFREVLVHYNNENIAMREYILDEMKWKFVEELSEFHPFGIEAIIAYAIKLQIIHRNLICTEEKGKQKLDSILFEIKKDYQIPAIF